MVAGCPPDSFSADGQLWGNPLYDWDRMKETGFAWWIRRLAAASRMYDVVRGMIRACMGAVSRLCVIQMQDYLELGAFARMNFPGTLSANNWTWRAPKGFITEELTKRIFDTTQRYGRL